MGLKQQYTEKKHILFNKINSLKSSSFKKMLFNFLKSEKFGKIVDSIPPSDPIIQFEKDVATMIRIKIISKELEEMKKRGEIV